MEVAAMLSVRLPRPGELATKERGRFPDFQFNPVLMAFPISQWRHASDEYLTKVAGAVSAFHRLPS